jgi:hypothetical protein
MQYFSIFGGSSTTSTTTTSSSNNFVEKTTNGRWSYKGNENAPQIGAMFNPFAFWNTHQSVKQTSINCDKSFERMKFQNEELLRKYSSQS